MTAPLKIGGSAHLLLSMACLEPLSAPALLERTEQRYGLLDVDHYGHVLRSLHQRGYLHQTGQARTVRYTLTREGEAYLNEHAEALALELHARRGGELW